MQMVLLTKLNYCLFQRLTSPNEQPLQSYFSTYHITHHGINKLQRHCKYIQTILQHPWKQIYCTKELECKIHARGLKTFFEP